MQAATVKNVHGILHKALGQSVKIGYIHFNPADACTLPRIVKKEMQVLDEMQIRAFLEAIRGDRYETLFTVTLFTGMREGEILGLTYDCVYFDSGVITIKQQLQQNQIKGDFSYHLAPLKNDRPRTIAPAAFVLKLLNSHRIKQLEARVLAGELWQNESDLAFTNEIGRPLSRRTVYQHFKKIAGSIRYA